MRIRQSELIHRMFLKLEQMDETTEVEIVKRQKRMKGSAWGKMEG